MLSSLHQKVKLFIHASDWGLLAALLIPLFAVMPLLTHAGLPNTADGPVHLMRQVELNQAWAEGNFYPRWGADLALGHGMPIFSYAPPFLYQLTQLIHLTGLPLDESMKGVVIFDFLLYSLGMFLFARRIFGPSPALLAAAVYVYAPYRLREAYIQGNYGQFSGLAFYPLILWAFHALITDERPRYLIAAALALAGLLFSHNISFMLFAPLLAAYLIFLLLVIARKSMRILADHPSGASSNLPPPFNWGLTTLPLNPPRLFITFHALRFILLRTLAGGLLGLGLAAIFWLPAFGERYDIKLEGITRGFFDFRENFITLPELLAPPRPLDLSAMNPEFPLSLGLPQIIGGAAAILVVIISRLQILRRRYALRTGRQKSPHPQPLSQIVHRGPLARTGESITLNGTLAPPVSSFSHTLFFIFFLLLYAFLALPASRLIWENAPLVALAEFPWRMLGPAILCAGVLAASALSLMLSMMGIETSAGESRASVMPPAKASTPGPPLMGIEASAGESGAGITPPAKASTPGPSLMGIEASAGENQAGTTPPAKASTPGLSNKIKYHLITLGLIFSVIALNAHYLYPAQFISWGTPTPAEAFAYEAASGAIGTTSTGEFLPRWAQQHPNPETLWPDYQAGRPIQKLDPATLPAGAAVEYLSHQTESDTLKIETPQPFVATLRTLYWPGWQIYLNDRPLPFTITNPTGLIQAAIPAGQHTLKLQLESSPLRTRGLWFSLLALSILLAIALHSGIKKSVNQGRSIYQVTQPDPDAPRTRAKPPCGTYYAPAITFPFFAAATALFIILYLLSRPLAPFFVLKSDPDYPQTARQHLQVDFADQLRLVGMNPLPDTIPLPVHGQGELAVPLYWRALQPTDHNYSIFLHLDAPNGQTFATVDEVNPENIPTRNWPPGLYLRHLLQLKLPANLPPIRYDLTTGVYNRETGRRLAIQPGGATSFRLGSIWLTPAFSSPAQPALAGFGPHITLHEASLSGNTLSLTWQTGQRLGQDYSIFVHVLTAEGSLLSQADGVPYDGLYPLSNWQPGQLISDARSLDLSQRPAMLAIGVYDPVTGQRLPAHGPNGQPLPENSFILSLAK